MKVTQFAKLFAIAALAIGGLSADSSAAIIVSDNFDGYANQAAFEAVWPAIGTGTPASATISTAQSVSPTNSILVPGNTTATTALTQSRNRRTFADTTALTAGAKVIFSFDFYDVSAANAPQRNYVNLQDTTAPGSTNQLVSMGLSNNLTSVQDGGNYYMARILGYTPTFLPPVSGPANPATSSGAYFKLNDVGAPVRTTGWHNLKVVIGTDDAVGTDYLFYVDNVLAKTVSNVGAAGTLRQYDNIAIGSGLSNGNVAANFDNMFLEYVAPIPEPTTLALAGMGMIGLVAAARRKSA